MLKRLLMFTAGLLFAFAPGASAQKLTAGLAVGGGMFFAEEDVMFSRDSLFASVHYSGVALPFLPGREARSGVGIEVGFPAAGEGEPAGSRVAYSLWSLNRADIIKGRVYGGTDMKFGQSESAEGYKWNFDARLVVGVYLGKAGPGNFILEIYSLEENRSVAGAIKYRF